MSYRRRPAFIIHIVSDIASQVATDTECWAVLADNRYMLPKQTAESKSIHYCVSVPANSPAAVRIAYRLGSTWHWLDQSQPVTHHMTDG